MAARARRRTPPALRRIRRLKLLTAILLLAALLFGLLLFGLVVSSADARYERGRVDRLVRQQVEAGLAQVHYSADGELVVGLASDPELVGGYPQLYVVELPDGTDGGAQVGLEP